MRSISTRFTGLLLVALGVWGGLVPFVGHYFHFALGPDKAWSWTTGRLYLDILPGVVTVLGGLNLMSAGARRSARLGALLALAGGIWFTIGPEISQLWHAGGAQGAGHGSAHIQMLEMLTYHTGLGVLVAALAGYALPRFPVIEEAAVGAGAGAMAGRDRRYDERSAREDVRDEEFDRQGATRQHHHLGRDAAIGAGAAGAVAAEHHHREREAEREEATRERVSERDTAATGDEPTAAGTGPGTPTPRTYGTDDPGHSGMRRRRGGLLGSLLRR